MIDPIIQQADDRRRKLGMTLAQHAEAAGMAQPHLSRYLAGQRQPSIGVLRRICRAVGLDIKSVRAKRR
jgi:transcriptional regulator with XRE-family HTH domain